MKLSTEKVNLICFKIQHDVENSLKTIAERMGVGYYTVREIYRLRTWKHVSKNYDFSFRRNYNSFHKNKGDW